MSTNKKPVTLVLLENENQYDCFLKSKTNLENENFIICALSISIINYCKENSIDFVIPDDYFSDEDRDICRKKSEEVIRDLVLSLNKYYSEMNSYNDFKFEMGNYHFFMLYHFFDALHFRAFFLKKLIDGIKPKRIIVFGVTNSKAKERPFPVSQYINCYYDLLINSVFRDKVTFLPIENKNKNIGFSLRKIISKVLRSFESIDNYLNIRNSGIEIKILQNLISKTYSEILLVGMSGPWKYVFKEASKLSFFYGSNEVNPKKLKPFNWFNEWFSWKDVFCGFNVAALGLYEMDRVRLLSIQILNMHKNHIRFIKKKKLLIYSVCPFPVQQYTLSVAQYLNIPTICYQHGEMSMHSQNLFDESSELLYASYYFSYGDMVSIDKEKVAKKYKNFKKAISTGSIALDNLAFGKSNNEEYILYASSKFVTYSAGFQPRYLDQDVFQNQQNITCYFADLISKNPGLKFVWKLNQEKLTEQPSTAISKNIKIVLDSPNFTELLINAKMVILDRPSTTSLEACMTNKPLFILLPKNFFYPATELLLKKRAIVMHSPNELLEAIDSFMRDGIYLADVENKEFVKLYGIHNDNEKVIDRIESNINNIMSGAMT